MAISVNKQRIIDLLKKRAMSMSETKTKPAPRTYNGVVQEAWTEESGEKLAVTLDTMPLKDVISYMDTQVKPLPHCMDRYTFLIDYVDHRKLHPLKHDKKVSDDED